MIKMDRIWMRNPCTVHFIFYGRESVPLCVLISVVHFEVDGWHLMSDLCAHVSLLWTWSTTPWNWFTAFSLEK
jgi:hypothetical protein